MLKHLKVKVLSAMALCKDLKPVDLHLYTVGQENISVFVLSFSIPDRLTDSRAIADARHCSHHAEFGLRRESRNFEFSVELINESEVGLLLGTCDRAILIHSKYSPKEVSRTSQSLLSQAAHSASTTGTALKCRAGNRQEDRTKKNEDLLPRIVRHGWDCAAR